MAPTPVVMPHDVEALFAALIQRTRNMDSRRPPSRRANPESTALGLIPPPPPCERFGGALWHRKYVSRSANEVALQLSFFFLFLPFRADLFVGRHLLMQVPDETGLSDFYWVDLTTDGDDILELARNLGGLEASGGGEPRVHLKVGGRV